MSGREEHYVAQAFQSNFVAPLGPQLDQFEAVMSDYLGGGLHCVGLSSGSAALHLALQNVGVTAGDDVWISSMTFAGGIFPVVYLGARPVFFDLDPASWTLSCDLIEEALVAANQANTLPKAIVPTDLYGQSADINRLEEICARFGVKLVVDSAESLGGAHLDGRKCGTGGDVSILSFNGNKIITTSGGGMLVTKHAKIAEQARFLATQARDPAPHYEHTKVGYNYRLSNICAAIGLGQMEVLDNRVAARRAVFDRYDKALGPLGLAFMPEPASVRSTRWLTTATVDPSKTGVTGEDIRLALTQQDIECRPLWKPMHMQPVFEGSRYIGHGVDEKLFETGLCLPSGSNMTLAEQDEVIAIVSNVLRRGGDT